MANTVKRNNKGEITHILVDNEMMLKENAHQVLYGSVDTVHVENYLNEIHGDVLNIHALDLIADILNEKESILVLKKKMMGFKKF